MRQPVLVTMAGGPKVDISSLSNFEAGILVLSELDRTLPGLTWGQLAAGVDYSGMSGWLTDLKKGVAKVVKAPGELLFDAGKGAGSLVMDTGRGVGSLVKNAADATGEGFGSFIRLMTDREVVDGANSAYKSFVDGGGVAGFWGGDFMNFQGGEGGQNAASGIWDFIVNLGAGAKGGAVNQASMGAGGFDGKTMALVLGGGLLLVLLVRR